MGVSDVSGLGRAIHGGLDVNWVDGSAGLAERLVVPVRLRLSVPLFAGSNNRREFRMKSDSRSLFPTLTVTISFLLLAFSGVAQGQFLSLDYPVSQNLYIPGSYAGRSFYYDRVHLGEDILLSEGTQIRAIADGRIVQYEYHSGYATSNDGTSIAAVIEHDLGRTVTLNLAVGDRKTVTVSKICSIYGHIRKSLTYGGARLGWQVGDIVHKGDIIGYVNDGSHNGDGGVHLHLGVRLGGHPGRWVYYGYESSSTPDSFVSNFAAGSEVIPALSLPVTVTDFFQKNANGQYTISCPTDNLVDAQFKLVNGSSVAIFFSTIALALHRESDDSFVADVSLQSNVTIGAGATYAFPRSFLDGTNTNLQPGAYRLVAKVFYGGAWIELAPHLPFTILSRSNNCGGSTVTDPLITALANTTQPVRWFYIMNQNTGAWYIVSPTGEDVMFLDKVDRNTTFGIYWRPVNNSSFQTYPDAGRNFSSVSISADGRTIYFGSAVGSPNDPHVSALANTTQPVRWFYILNQSTGWYIVSPTGQQVMFLDRVDQSTSFGIYWKPINNSSFTGYNSANQNYSSVTISSDGRTTFFGPLM